MHYNVRARERFRPVLLLTCCAAAGLGLLSYFGAAAAARPASPYKGTPEDFMEISQLFSMYNYTIDNRDGVAWAGNFAPDGVFQDPSWCAIGREQLIKVVGHSPQMGHDQMEHHDHNLGPIVYQDHDHASVHSTVMVVGEKGPGEPGGGIAITGTYDDRLVRLNGRCVFAYRLVHRPATGPAVACSVHP